MAATHVHAHDPRVQVVGVYAALAGLCALVLVRDPLHQTVFPPCPLRAATGLWCPGCGATRASALLLRGHPIEALHYNLLWVAAAPFVVYALAVWGLEAFGVRRLPRLPPGRLVPALTLVALIGFFVIRNIPGLDLLNPVLGA